jgi:hypothetical protein
MTDFSIPDFRKLVRDADTEKIRHLRDDTYIININGEDEIVELATRATKTKVGDLHSLLDLALGSHARAILVSETEIRLVMNDLSGLGALAYDEDGPDNATPAELLTRGGRVDALTGAAGVAQRWGHVLPLNHHPAFLEVGALRKSRDFTHKQLIRALRTTLADFVDSSTLNNLRALDLSVSETGTSVVRNGDAGMGRAVVQQVRQQNGQGTVPDEITLSVPVYDMTGVRADRYPVRIIVEVDPAGGTPVFTLTAVHNDIVAAQDAALDKIINDCAKVFPLVLRGTLN